MKETLYVYTSLLHCRTSFTQLTLQLDNNIYPTRPAQPRCGCTLVYSSASQPVCRGTQVCHESSRSVPWPNVGSENFSMRSFNEVFNCHWKRL